MWRLSGERKKTGGKENGYCLQNDISVKSAPIFELLVLEDIKQSHDKRGRLVNLA